MTYTGRKRAIAVNSTLSANTIKSRITVSRDLEKYFRHYDFFSRYDARIVDNSSILDIPALSLLLPLAWTTGADIYVDELDKTFANSMDSVHREFRRMHPRLPFQTRLVADRLVNNKYASNDTALLYSGGLDSTYSLFSNIALKPRLIMIFGTADIPISNLPFQKTLEKEYSAFAEREGLILSFIRTNAMELLDFGRLDHLFGRLQSRSSLRTYWDGIGYMLCHIGQAAPLSIGRFGHLLAASGAVICASKYPSAEWIGRDAGARIGWANVGIEWHGAIPRHEKAFFLKDFLDARRSKLRVCLNSAWTRTSLNCSLCEKCLLAITMLAAADIDPNECGFSMDGLTFNRTRRVICHTSAQEVAIHWKPLQEAISDAIGLDRYGARPFFEWFKMVDFDSMRRPYRSPLSNLYYKLPYSIARTSACYRTGAAHLRLSAKLWLNVANNVVNSHRGNNMDR